MCAAWVTALVLRYTGLCVDELWPRKWWLCSNGFPFNLKKITLTHSGSRGARNLAPCLKSRHSNHTTFSVRETLQNYATKGPFPGNLLPCICGSILLLTSKFILALQRKSLSCLFYVKTLPSQVLCTTTSCFSIFITVLAVINDHVYWYRYLFIVCLPNYYNLGDQGPYLSCSPLSPAPKSVLGR